MYEGGYPTCKYRGGNHEKKTVFGSGASRGAGGPFEGSLGGAKEGHGGPLFYFEGGEWGPGWGDRYVRIFASLYQYVDKPGRNFAWGNPILGLKRGGCRGRTQRCSALFFGSFGPWGEELCLPVVGASLGVRSS